MSNPQSHMGISMRTSAFTLTALALAATLSAQAPAAPSAAPSAQIPPAPQAGAAPASEAYSYNPEGRRDPFVSLLTRGVDAGQSRETHTDGRQGLAIGDVSVRGIVRTRNAFVAMLQGPDNKTYIIHTGDKMLDGVVKAITTDAVVFAQDVNDPLSLVKQREVRKTLRGPEEAK